MRRKQHVGKSTEQIIDQAAREEERADGRTRFQARPTQLRIDRQVPYAEVRRGMTFLTATLSSRLAEPRRDRPTEGVVTVHMDGRDEARALERLLRTSGILDTESLCEEAGVAVWHVRVDVRVLQDDGGVLDAAALAVVATLRCGRVPERRPLSLVRSPLLYSMAFLEEAAEAPDSPETRLLVDPTSLERTVAPAPVSVAVDESGRVCALYFQGPSSLPLQAMKICVKQAMALATVDRRLLEKALEVAVSSDISV